MPELPLRYLYYISVAYLILATVHASENAFKISEAQTKDFLLSLHMYWGISHFVFIVPDLAKQDLYIMKKLSVLKTELLNHQLRLDILTRNVESYLENQQNTQAVIPASTRAISSALFGKIVQKSTKGNLFFIFESPANSTFPHHVPINSRVFILIKENNSSNVILNGIYQLKENGDMRYTVVGTKKASGKWKLERRDLWGQRDDLTGINIRIADMRVNL